MSIPIGLELDHWKLIVRALKKLGADSKEISSQELANVSDTNDGTIRSNLKFLHFLELISPESKAGSIRLSQRGNEYVQLLIMDNKEEEKKFLATICSKKFKDLLSFYELHEQNQDLTFEKIFNQIKFLTNAPDVIGKPGNTHGNYKTGIYSVINLLIYSGLIDQKYNPESHSFEVLKEKSSQPRNKTEIPLHCSPEWMNRFFQAIKNVNPHEIKREFITANVCGSRHEGSVLALARFLDIIDKNGNLKENYEKLRLIGEEEFKKNLSQIIQEKYNKIFSITDLTNAERKNLETVFMKEYNLGNDQAVHAISVFIGLCQLSGIPLSVSLTTRKSITKKTIPVNKKASKPIANVKTITESQGQVMPSNTTESSVKINLNINVEVKDKDSKEVALDFIKKLTTEIRNQLPKLDVNITESNTSQD